MLGYKRIKQASIALLAAACLVLSGCGRDGGSVSLVEAGPAQEQGGGSYVPQTLASEAEIGTIFSAAPAEDGLYVFGSKLMLLGFDGSVETIPSISSVVKMCAGDGGTAWVLHRLPTDADSAPSMSWGGSQERSTARHARRISAKRRSLSACAPPGTWSISP